MTKAETQAGVRVLRAGEDLARADAAVVLIHGRGATAEGMLGLSLEFGVPGLAYATPQAPGSTWYPHSFLAPLEANEPKLSQSLAIIDEVVADVVAKGVPHERIVLIGFSQGACLAAEYAARQARRWGGVMALTGGLIGPEGSPRDYAGSLAGTPVFLGSSDVDAHVPLARVHETAEVLGRLGAEVTTRIYPGMGHTIVADEIAHVRRLLSGFPPRAEAA
jgi:phospholipase/carboxylesterase